MLGRIIKIFVSSNLQGRPSIFRDFLLGRIIEILVFSILQKRHSILKEFSCFKSAKLSSLQSQKSTKAAVLVALVVMTPLHIRGYLSPLPPYYDGLINRKQVVNSVFCLFVSLSLQLILNVQCIPLCVKWTSTLN